MKTSISRALIIGLIGTVTFPVIASAHSIGGGHSGFVGGLHHPLLGWDHALAMLAVGIWAVQSGKRALWALPLSFLALMGFGAAVGIAGIHVPMVEGAILTSVMVLGLLVAFAARLPNYQSMLLVGAFAFFHGHAHGSEMSSTSSVGGYFLGFAAATAMLHLVGISFGLSCQKIQKTSLFRLAGAAIAVGGVLVCV